MNIAERVIDLRGLEPPEPLMRIFEAVATLPPSTLLRARTDRRPVFLYAELETRGFHAETQVQSDGSHITTICRK